MTALLKALIKFYRYAISPCFPPSCRFQPTCSEYALTSVENRGLKGIFPSIIRVLKCHPFHSGGYDPPLQSNKAKILRRNTHWII